MHRRVVRDQRARRVAQPFGNRRENVAIGREVRFLRDIGHLQCGLPPHRTVVERCLPRQYFQQAGFTRTVTSDQRDALARVELERRTVEQIDVSERKAGIVDGKQRHEREPGQEWTTILPACRERGAAARRRRGSRPRQASRCGLLPILIIDAI